MADFVPEFQTPPKFRPYNPKQGRLLPADLGEWLPEGHLAHHVDDIVDSLDLGALHAPYQGDGRRNSPFDPRMMLKVLVHAYATGVFPSRRIARRLEEDVAFRMLAADNFPSRRTICGFRRRHLADFRRLFAQVVRLAGGTGLAKFGTLSVDGAKVRANASKRKATGYARMKEAERRLEAEISELPGRAGSADADEDGRFGADARGDGAEGLAEDKRKRLETIRAAKARLEAREREAEAEGSGPPREPDGKAQSNSADPESGIMPTSSEGFQQCCNAGVAVASDGQPVVATEVRASPSDQGTMLGLVDQAEAACGEAAGEVLAELEKRGIDGYVATGREGREAVRRHPASKPATRRMAGKLATPEGRKRYAQRKWLSEAPNGWIKEAMGFRRFSVRGLAKVRGEWDLVCLALNLRRMKTLMAAWMAGICSPKPRPAAAGGTVAAPVGRGRRRARIAQAASPSGGRRNPPCGRQAEPQASVAVLLRKLLARGSAAIYPQTVSQSA